MLQFGTDVRSATALPKQACQDHLRTRGKRLGSDCLILITCCETLGGYLALSGVVGAEAAWSRKPERGRASSTKCTFAIDLISTLEACPLIPAVLCITLPPYMKATASLLLTSMLALGPSHNTGPQTPSSGYLPKKLFQRKLFQTRNEEEFHHPPKTEECNHPPNPGREEKQEQDPLPKAHSLASAAGRALGCVSKDVSLFLVKSVKIIPPLLTAGCLLEHPAGLGVCLLYRAPHAALAEGYRQGRARCCSGGCKLSASTYGGKNPTRTCFLSSPVSVRTDLPVKICEGSGWVNPRPRTVPSKDTPPSHALAWKHWGKCFPNVDEQPLGRSPSLEVLQPWGQAARARVTVPHVAPSPVMSSRCPANASEQQLTAMPRFFKCFKGRLMGK
ncbi:hypothetical protein Anapl_14675 [Anas platyrhynchos]|uniref:Uncharacterized protein n=1 Tax=Anas platyrhynchos TaxID=8839 RepID=R0LJ71_ANAPL|nr:hypothetical protein Anapl_14675 [Anas platyrhynchos]